MKLTRFHILTILCTLGVFSQCQEPVNQNLAETKPTIIHTGVGSQIPLETASRWIDRATNNSYTRKPTGTCKLSSEQLQALVEYTVTGLALHHALDESGVYHVLAIPIDQTRRLWNSPFILDTNTGAVIPSSIAKNWAIEYNNMNPTGIQFHFFGSKMLSTISQLSNLNRVEIIPAINDEGKPQLVLLAKIAKLASNRIAEDECTLAYDKSYPCPPCGG